MDWGGEYIGTFLLIVGVLLLLWKRKRVFDRTNAYGVERFSSFSAKVGAKMKDGILSGGGILLFSTGFFILAIRYQDSWGWMILLPVYAILLVGLIGT